MKKLFSLFLLVVVSMSVFACQPEAPQATVTPPQATATLPPTETPAPTATQTLTPTPTPIAYSSDQLAAMSEDEQLAAGRTAAQEMLKDVTVVGEEMRGSQYWASKTEMYENEFHEIAERTVVAGVYDLLTGEYLERYSALEVQAMFASEGTLPDSFVFDGEIVTKAWDTESALGRAQQATYRGVEYPAGVTVWQDADGNVELVDWPYWLGGPHRLMVATQTADGRLITLSPAEAEVRYDLSGVSHSETNDIYSVVLRGVNNPDLEAVLLNTDGTVIVVLGLQSDTTGYWEGSESAQNKTKIKEFSTASQIKMFTADLRDSGDVVSTSLLLDGFIDKARVYLTNEADGEIGLQIANALMASDQTTNSSRGDNIYTDYSNPVKDITYKFRIAGIGMDFIE